MLKELLEKKEKYGHSVGPAIRARRKELGMTVVQLAGKSGLSGAFISLIERGKSSYSLVSLQSIAEALDVDIGYFIDVPEGESLVKRAGANDYLDIDSPVKYRLLSSSLPHQRMEQISMEIPPGYQFPFVKRDGEGFIYVLEGELVITVAGDESVLGPGDSIHYDYQAGIGTANHSEKPTVLLWCGAPAWLHKNLTDNEDSES
ncbi:cupin domain-containing protein [Parahaliea mediterranea]|uniref:Helix-turn-helix transcriptional regulator n=1 Tax=Parahaliea mediterranea TaxID=651086 RepID=A0A939DEX9_9GAMM|nr:helix-turn-helix transcriptional regulator [Parahaliea mediterranea]